MFLCIEYTCGEKDFMDFIELSKTGILEDTQDFVWYLIHYFKMYGKVKVISVRFTNDRLINW